MRVTGNSIPPEIAVHPIVGTLEAEVRLTENVQPVDDPESTLYTYDEYIFRIKQNGTTERDIEANLKEWLLTGRSKEFDPNVSAVFAMEENHLAELGELIEEIYNEDLEAIENV